MFEGRDLNSTIDARAVYNSAMAVCFNKDPELHKDAKQYKQISYSEILTKNLRIMDMTAITLCKENNLPIRVFDVNGKGNLNSILTGKDIGTIIS